MRQYLIMTVIALLAGFAGAAVWSLSGLSHTNTREYLVANPDILPEMADAYQASQMAERLGAVEEQVTTPFAGAVLGNPQGSKTLVKFTDYACGFCKSSIPDIDRLIAEDPELRVVVREYPIFEGSDLAGRMALAAARQGKYSEFYHAMFDAGSTDNAAIQSAALAAGLDMEQAQVFAASDEAASELAQNIGYARDLGFGGTPSWVVNGQAFEGAVGYDKLKAAVDSPRDS